MAGCCSTDGVAEFEICGGYEGECQLRLANMRKQRNIEGGDLFERGEGDDGRNGPSYGGGGGKYDHVVFPNARICCPNHMSRPGFEKCISVIWQRQGERIRENWRW